MPNGITSPTYSKVPGKFFLTIYADNKFDYGTSDLGSISAAAAIATAAGQTISKEAKERNEVTVRRRDSNPTLEPVAPLYVSQVWFPP